MAEGLWTHAAYSDFILICVNMLQLWLCFDSRAVGFRQHILPSWFFKINLKAKGVKEHRWDKLQGAEIFISTFSCKNIHHVGLAAKLICKRKYHIQPAKKYNAVENIWHLGIFFAKFIIKKSYTSQNLAKMQKVFSIQLGGKRTSVPKLNVKWIYMYICNRHAHKCFYFWYDCELPR